MKIIRNSAISSVVSVLEVFTAICGIILILYLVVASKSRVLL